MRNIVEEIAKEILALAPEIYEMITSSYNNLKSGGSIKSEIKDIHPQDLATELDHAIGKLYIEKVFNKYRSFLKIDSEEEEERLGDGEIVMRFDPLDGTKHFFKGIPMLASAVALVVDGVTKFGMVLNIFSKETYHAFEGHGAYLNNKRITVSNSGISDNFSFIMYESPHLKIYSDDEDAHLLCLEKISEISKHTYRMRNFGLSSLSICLVADGSCPAYVDLSGGTTKLYDVEAAVLIASEAGAIIGDTQGNTDNILEHNSEGVKKLTKQLLVANQRSFAQIITILNK